MRWNFSNPTAPSVHQRVVKCLYILICNTKTIQVVAMRLDQCIEQRTGFKMRPSRSRCHVPVKRWNFSNSAVSPPIEGEKADEAARRWHRATCGKFLAFLARARAGCDRPFLVHFSIYRRQLAGHGGRAGLLQVHAGDQMTKYRRPAPSCHRCNQRKFPINFPML
jgi:hypothetical protein